MKRGRPFLANWRAIRVWEADTRHRLSKRHALWLHGWCIGLGVLAVMWAASYLQMLLGNESLALRYLVTLGVGYVAFLLMLRVWAGTLAGEEHFTGESADAAQLAADVAGEVANVAMSSPADAAELASGLGKAAGGLGDVASGAFEVAGSADEGALVVVPVVAVFVGAFFVLLSAGWLLLLFFGADVLLAVAVEIAFGYVSARTAVRVVREGWLSAAVRLTWKPLLGALVCAVVLGGLIDHFLPQAESLPHAISLLRAKP